jgi:glutathione S-transferase
MDLKRTLDVATSYVATGLRGVTALAIGPTGARPDKPLELYEFESCPFCRKVRETLVFLDLEIFVYPCPKGGERFRARAAELGGKAQFPFLVDPNSGEKLYDSERIIDYLVERYGKGQRPWQLTLGPLTQASSVLASLSRGGRGRAARPSKAPAKPLELYNSESSPFCRIVRERLCELELPYLCHNVAGGSAGRPAFVARSGKQMIPYLADPNTRTEMFESADIVRYLQTTYGA